MGEEKKLETVLASTRLDVSLGGERHSREIEFCHQVLLLFGVCLLLLYCVVFLGPPFSSAFPFYFWGCGLFAFLLPSSLSELTFLTRQRL